jgi:CubicO group peptidase (beta-lactamase class C family)
MGTNCNAILDVASLRKKANNLLQASVRRSGLPFALAVISDDRSNVYQGSFGSRVWGTEEAVDLDTVIHIASATKPITATAALQLVESGVLRLDVPASTYAPEINQLVVLEGWDDNGSPITRRPKVEITLRHLLTHTSGLSYEMWNPDIPRYMAHEGIPSLETLDRKCLFTPLIADPGTKWEYGISLDWVGQIIEAVSGQGLEDYFLENIFRPLGMTGTSFKLTDKMAERLGKIHVRDAQGKIEATDVIAEQNGEFEESGGGLYSTCNDYIRFLRMILNRGMGGYGQVLRPETVDLLKNNAIGDIQVTALKTVSPEASNDAEFFPGLVKNWSLGFMRNETIAPTGRSAGSLAWAGLFNFYFWIDPKVGLGGVFSTQLLPFADKLALDTFLDFERSVYSSISAH